MPDDNPIPVCLVTGFLGSGKTTLLDHLARRHADRRLVFVVNEFATLDVDGRLLDGHHRVVPVPGGSIFCTCLVTKFAEVMNRIADEHEADPIDGVIVEASGIANPTVAGKLLVDTKLDARFQLAHTVCVVDPQNLAVLLHTLPNVHAQIAASDTAVINKTDLHDTAAIDAVERRLRGIHPGMVIHHAAFGVAEFPLFGTARHGVQASPTGEYARCADPNYFTAIAELPDGMTRAELAALLDALAGRVYRVKGFVQLDTGPVYVDIAADRLGIRDLAPPAGPIDTSNANSSLVVIARNTARDRIQGELARWAVPRATAAVSLPEIIETRQD